MARVAKSVSINTETDKDILDKIENVPNFSDYVKELIREDIKDNSTSFTKKQKEDIKKLIIKVLNDENFVVNKSNDKKVDQDQLDAIDNLFKV